MIDFTRLEEVRQRRPLIHCVSNTVSANDCANLVLAVGASPIMAHDPQEMESITAISQATVLNTGTPEEAKFRACLLCGQAAERQRQPVALDPVGVGASPWRLRQVYNLLGGFTPTILRVNLAEAQALDRGTNGEQGVDSPAPAALEERREAALALARKRRTVVLLSGPEDIAADRERAWRIGGGSAQMARVTGTGCMLSALCGVFAAVEEDPLQAAVLASSFWKACAQKAEILAEERGPGSFHAALMDAAGTLDIAAWKNTAELEEL